MASEIKLEDFDQWVEALTQYHLPRWSNLPDIFLYKDQVVTLVEKYVAPFAIEESLITPAMINNYVKLGIIPKPDNKKRYERRHVAFLIAVTLLKAVLPLKLIGEAIYLQAVQEGELLAYDGFCDGIERAIADCVNAYFKKASLSEEVSKDTFLLRFGCQAFANKLIAMKYVDLAKKDNKWNNTNIASNY